MIVFRRSVIPNPTRSWPCPPVINHFSTLMTTNHLLAAERARRVYSVILYVTFLTHQREKQIRQVSDGPSFGSLGRTRDNAGESSGGRSSNGLGNTLNKRVRVCKYYSAYASKGNVQFNALTSARKPIRSLQIGPWDEIRHTQSILHTASR